jgi:hypothetical protein
MGKLVQRQIVETKGSDGVRDACLDSRKLSICKPAGHEHWPFGT